MAAYLMWKSAVAVGEEEATERKSAADGILAGGCAVCCQPTRVVAADQIWYPAYGQDRRKLYRRKLRERSILKRQLAGGGGASAGEGARASCGTKEISRKNPVSSEKATSPPVIGSSQIFFTAHAAVPPSRSCRLSPQRAELPLGSTSPL